MAPFCRPPQQQVPQQQVPQQQESQQQEPQTVCLDNQGAGGLRIVRGGRGQYVACASENKATPQLMLLSWKHLRTGVQGCWR